MKYYQIVFNWNNQIMHDWCVSGGRENFEPGITYYFLAHPEALERANRTTWQAYVNLRAASMEEAKTLASEIMMPFFQAGISFGEYQLKQVHHVSLQSIH